MGEKEQNTGKGSIERMILRGNTYISGILLDYRAVQR